MDAYLLYAVGILGLIEFTLSVLWTGPYFRFGIPVYRRKLSVGRFRPGLADELERYQDSGGARPLIFRALSSDEIAFREKAYGLYWVDYAPVMRGLIHRSANRREMMLTAKLNWYVMILPVVMIFLVQSVSEFMFVPLVLLILFAIYKFQSYRFNAVADLLEKRAKA